MENAHLVFVNKADGDGLPAARLAADHISRALPSGRERRQ